MNTISIGKEVLHRGGVRIKVQTVDIDGLIDCSAITLIRRCRRLSGVLDMQLGKSTTATILSAISKSFKSTEGRREIMGKLCKHTWDEIVAADSESQNRWDHVACADGVIRYGQDGIWP